MTKHVFQRKTWKNYKKQQKVKEIISFSMKNQVVQRKNMKKL